VGESLIISILFHKSLNNEIEKTQSENLMMRMEIATLLENYNRSLYRGEEEALDSVLKNLTFSWESNKKQFLILDKKLNIKNTNIIHIEQIAIHEIPENEKTLIYRINKNEESYSLLMCTKLKLAKEEILIINSNDISEVFYERNEMLKIVFLIVFCIGIGSAFINGAIVRWISKPIKEMTAATRKIMEGNMEVKVSTKSKDELGILGECFNAMTESLEKSIKELKDAARRQEDFVGSFAHEIKTPLTSIIGYADILRSKKLDEGTTFTAANYIFNEGKRLENLSIKLLELIVERNTQLQKKKISMSKLVKDTVAIMKRGMDEKRIKLEVDVDAFEVYVDIDLMKTVLINILDNARKAVKENGIIKIRSWKENGNIAVSIKDNGRGIPKEDLEKIKEAFYMVDKSRAREEGGAGLGLSICTQIIKLHNGEIHFESDLAEGTRVLLIWRDDDERVY
jgi:signal transduction histidine kinase